MNLPPESEVVDRGINDEHRLEIQFKYHLFTSLIADVDRMKVSQAEMIFELMDRCFGAGRAYQAGKESRKRDGG